MTPSTADARPDMRIVAPPGSACNAPTLPDLLHAVCSVAPEQMALEIDDGSSMARGALLEQCERFAGYMAGRIRNGEPVVILLGNRIEYFVAFFGVIAAGGVAVSANPGLRDHDLEHVLTDSGARFVICAEESVDLVQRVRGSVEHARHTIVLNGPEPDGLARYQAGAGRLAFRDTGCRREDTAVVLYTSGTTGVPKGCMLHHGWWMRVVDLDLRLDPEGRHRPLCSVPFFYGDPVHYLLEAMVAGGSMVAMRRFSVSRYWEVVARYRVSKIHAVGTMPNLLLKRPVSELERPDHVHHATCLGVPADRHAELVARFGFPWLDNYGVTEAGLVCRMPFEMAGEMVGRGSIGVPNPEVDLRIVDDQGREATPGIPGEILVRAPDMFRGYLNRPQETERAFVNGWYRTGDVGTRDERGFVYFVARAKDVVRRGEQNIAATEVETVLRSHPLVADVAVIAVPDDIRGEEVKAYVLLVDGASPRECPPQALIDHCEQALAAFKVPRYIAYRTGDFPRTPSMRIRKELLRAESGDLRAGAWDRVRGAVVGAPE
jgi:crotonobetaine/carnitine-CoA ligase